MAKEKPETRLYLMKPEIFLISINKLKINNILNKLIEYKATNSVF